jgi:hypothetical protein
MCTWRGKNRAGTNFPDFDAFGPTSISCLEGVAAPLPPPLTFMERRAFLKLALQHLKTFGNAKWHFRDSKLKNVLGPSALAFSPPPQLKRASYGPDSIYNLGKTPKEKQSCYFSMIRKYVITGAPRHGNGFLKMQRRAGHM